MKRKMIATALAVSMLLGIACTANAEEGVEPAANGPQHEIHHVTIETSVKEGDYIPIGTDPLGLVISFSCDEGCTLSEEVEHIDGNLNELGTQNLGFSYSGMDNSIDHRGVYDIVIHVEDPANPTPRPLKGVSLDRTEITVNKGEEFTLILSTEPTENAFIQDRVSWRMDKSGILELAGSASDTGKYGEKSKFKAVEAGSTTITASLQGFTVNCTVTVNESATPPQPETPPDATPEEQPEPSVNYPDVKNDAWYYDAVAFISSKGIMSGYANGNFGPAEKLGRGQFATILYRMEGSPGIAYQPVFPDVPDGQFYSIPAVWAHGEGIITGFANGNFGAIANIDREQLVTMMYRYANYKGFDTSKRAEIRNYPDAWKVSAFAKDSMSWAVGMGLVSGDQGNLNPQGTAARAVAATIIQRFMMAYGI